MAEITILLADDHEIFRQGVKQLINSEPDMKVISEASDGEEAIAMTNELQPDVLILDISMPGLNGIDVTQHLIKNKNKTKILIFSLYDREDYVVSALNLGASGYILKDTSNKIFLNAIRSVNNGEFYYIGEVSDILVNEYRKLKNSEITEGKTIHSVQSNTKIHLSKREKEILKLISTGKTNKEIADAYKISVRTIETHRLNIMRKFMVKSMEEVLVIVKEYHLID